MNINNFKNYIDKTIFDRGYSYYLEGNVVDAFEKGENEYIFYIEGTDDYEVLVEIEDGGDILHSECDCPYDFGPVCKHEVAAFFQLSSMLNAVTTETESKPSKRTTIQEVLTNLSKEELINIIINITNKDATLENSLIVRYSNGDHSNEIEACKKLIHSIVRKYLGREGFIKYRDTGDFVGELEDVLDKARKTNHVLVALDIALLLLEEAVGAFQYADDSDGDIGYLVSETLEFIGEIVTCEMEQDQHRIEIFERVLAQTNKKIFDGWLDFKVDLLEICFEFADDVILREQLTHKIETMLDEHSNDSYTHYSNERLLQLLFQLINQYGTEEEAEQFINKHLQFSSFRELLLNKFIQEENYHKVIEVAKKGEVQDKQYLGLVSKWKKYRYDAYKFLLLIEEQRNLAKELLLKGDFNYYQELKELASENQSEFYANLKKELKTGEGRATTDIFLKIIEHENDLEELLEFVKNNPRLVEVYAEKLVKLYEDEVINIYKRFIETVASHASNRRDYQGVCQKIKKFKKIAGKTKQVDLVKELMGLYVKRPAFMDELGKVK
ncbi:hypothetical protein SM124_16380 [Bacillus sp. 31A1R]|uniref:SWIM-type domain-containing protein n=1 Tax=Robertmurraya mangrovi TaxID=3098077 RepID=A0ABU5J1Q7_9BACI|nr:hypothetical protein [Bacillus sp. 31A1R]MDZ5473296.1 hypothetical protein [Bacillus sp. 31A1R]